MAEKIPVAALKKVIAENGRYIEILVKDVTPVVCLNKTTGKNRLMNFKALYDNNNRFWLLEGTWDYYLKNEDFTRIREAELAARIIVSPAPGKTASETGEKNPEPEPEIQIGEKSGNPGFGEEYAVIADMSALERVERVNEDKNRLDSLITQKSNNHETVTAALVDTTRNAALINRATLLEAMRAVDSEARKRTQALVDSTQNMVKSSAALITENIFNDDLMNTLVEKSNGTVIRHMTRVFLNGTAFLAYYNNLVSGSSVINKLRIGFDKKYKKYYRQLLPHLHADDITLEKVFYKGMRAIRGEEFLNWAVGFLIHDIGKAGAVEYHEGEAAYNRDIVIEHVKTGYTAVMNKTNYPRDAGLITGYHHEYYGDPAGYGYFRAYLDQYKKLKPDANQEACIAYELEPMMDYHALAYFPAKILEIIDVYDSVTDPNRKYRKALIPEEALAMLREEFIDKHPKIDIILYDLFVDFVRRKPAKKK